MTEYEKLTDRLADWLADVTEDRADTAQLDAILDALDALDPPPDEPDPAAALERFHQDYAGLFAKAEAEARKKPVKRAGALRKLVLIAAILLAAMMTAQALGVDVFGALGRWTKENFRFGSAADQEAVATQYPMPLGETVEYASMEAALAAFGVEAPIAPQWIPERFQEDRFVFGTVSPTGAIIGADYTAEDAVLHITLEEVNEASRLFIEKDERPPGSYFHNGQHYYIFFDNQRVKAVWKNGDFLCHISGMISEAEAKRMIDSIYS